MIDTDIQVKNNSITDMKGNHVVFQLLRCKVIDIDDTCIKVKTQSIDTIYSLLYFFEKKHGLKSSFSLEECGICFNITTDTTRFKDILDDNGLYNIDLRLNVIKDLRATYRILRITADTRADTRAEEDTRADTRAEKETCAEEDTCIDTCAEEDTCIDTKDIKEACDIDTCDDTCDDTYDDTCDDTYDDIYDVAEPDSMDIEEIKGNITRKIKKLKKKYLEISKRPINDLSLKDLISLEDNLYEFFQNNI